MSDKIVEAMARASDPLSLVEYARPVDRDRALSSARRAFAALLCEVPAIGNGALEAVVVPREPTEAMKEHAALQVMMTDWEDITEDDKVCLIETYRAMIAAGDTSDRHS